MKVKNAVKKITFALCSVLLSATMFVSTGAISAVAEGLSQPVGGNYFKSDYNSKSELKAAGEKVRDQIRDEGHVMLKNEDDILPLAKGTKISVFGKNYGYAGFSASEFANEGFEINNELVKFYGDSSRSGTGLASISHANVTMSGLLIGETPVANYDATVEASYENYNDAALVYFYRSVGEGRDAPRTMLWDGVSYGTAWNENCTQVVPGARSGDDHYLQLDQNEADLLQYVGDRFDTVVVVLVSGAQMETGFLDDPNHYAYHENIKAAFWTGGASGLARILSGKVNPSAKTVDTWYRDFKLDPTWQNCTNNLSINGNRYSNLSSWGDYLNRYVIYQEGIYIGYRYYETRGYLEGDAPYTSPSDGDRAFHGTTTTEWSSWYDANVIYPYGYGLSYTTFTQEIVDKEPAANSVLSSDGTITVQVKVTNTGTVAGKEVVQLYYTAPYTESGIEKAYVVLGAFGKTDILQPGASEIVTLKMDVRDMSSYDWNDANGNGFKGYELDPGEYTIRLMANAHEEIEHYSYTISSGVRYETSEETGEKIENRFDKVSNYLVEEVKKQYMSRADFEGTFPSMSIELTAPQWVVDGLKEWMVSNGVSTRDPSADEGMPYYTEEMPTTEAENGLVLSDMYGKDYDDEAWSDFLDQLSYQELVKLATQGSYYSGVNIPRLGITKQVNTDGIGGLVAYAHHSEAVGSTNNIGWGAQVLLAASWNTELAYQKGRIVGNEGLWGGSLSNTRLPGWYAPGVNIHRTPFGGRNSQYFGEDGFFAGRMAAQIVKGAKDKGMFCYVKHFGLNEQESNRLGVLTWANEQSMREIYLKGFELCVTEGGTTAIMSALNRVGYTWTGGSYELLTEILRNEWGFKGCVVTDSYMGDTSNLSNADQMIRAGGNLALGNASLRYNKETATTVSVLREMAHGLLYMHANSMALNDSDKPIDPPKLTAYKGSVLPTGSYMFPFAASVATATINEKWPEYSASDIVYTLAEGSNPLPAGLTLNEDGTITGTPTEQAENYRITVNATLDGETMKTTFTLNITSGSAEIVYSAATGELETATVGHDYSVSVATAEYFAPSATEDEIAALPKITYALKNGSSLPAGLRLTEGGKIIGRPTEQCLDYRFSVMAKADGMTSKTVEYSITVLAEMTFEGKELKEGRFGENYLDRVQLAECDNEVTYRLKEGSTLPAGLTLTEGGYIAGKPTQTVKDHKFIVEAVSKYSETKEAEYSISIAIKFGTNTVAPDAAAGEEYSTRIDTVQGSGSVKYSLKAGNALPEGMTLSEDGKISGTPTKAGVYKVTFVADAGENGSDEITLTFYVAGTVNETEQTTVYVGVACGAVVLAFVVFRPKKSKKKNKK